MRSKETVPPSSSLAQRVLTAVVLIAGLCFILWQGGWMLALLICVALGQAVHEELTILQKRGYHPVWWASFAIPAVGWALSIGHMASNLMLLLPILCMGILFTVMIRQKPMLEDIAVSVLPILSIILPGVCVFEMMGMASRSMLNFYLILLFTIPILTDTFAYFTGRTIGGKKLCPQMSPNKTVSGAIGGLFGGIIGAIATLLVFRCFAPQNQYPAWILMILVGLVGSVASQMGDLFASLIKRHCNVKDFGKLFPGHGGMMDRIDSILFSGIIVYLFYRITMMI